MSLRDWFAGQTHIPWEVAEHVATEWNGHSPSVAETLEARAKLRMLEADAMLAQRREKDP